MTRKAAVPDECQRLLNDIQQRGKDLSHLAWDLSHEAYIVAHGDIDWPAVKSAGEIAGADARFKSKLATVQRKFDVLARDWARLLAAIERKVTK
jgi:hypothetical protein